MSNDRLFFVDQASLPNLPGMMLRIIEALRAIGGSAHIRELDEKVIELEGVTEDEQSLPMSGDDPRNRVNYYLAWARTYLKRGGAIENKSRAVWTLTSVGFSIGSIDATKEIYERVNQEERERARQKRKSQKNAGPQLTQVEKVQFIEQQSLNLEVNGDGDVTARDWSENLLEVVGRMNAAGFERLSQRLLRVAGFTKVEVRGKSGDGGIDGVGVLRVNLVSFQIYFQCKKWKGSVGSKEIRDFRGALQGRADKGLFITTGTFTAQASDEATRDGAIAIDLIDGERLCELLKEHGLGVKTKTIEVIEIDENWFSEV
ncbi:restriction endonuclease [Roseicyclus sp.]|uniref:restriction endonuclease n=1 Tax=Roseicyclus sp. TaxID=1914329 RepID=UPI001BCE8A5C|nr:restriction endonuclease [Roseicyclus sp.]